MKKRTKKYVVRILASVHEADDKEFENPKATMLEIPVSAFSAEEARDKVGEVIGNIATKHTAEKRRQELQEAEKQRHIGYSSNPCGEISLGTSGKILSDGWSIDEPGALDYNIEELFKKYL